MPEVVSPRPPAADGQWVRQEEQPEAAEPLADFRLFAIICTWMEEDVVGATIASCFRQGCDGVYLVDNASPDATVARAAEAGAVPARSFESERFDDSEKTQQMQVVVDEVSARESADHIWWLWVDADEFYHGPGGLTLRDYLASLDRRFRIVGARFFQHLPSRQPLPDELGDPRSYQPLSYEIRYPMCAAGHYKHALHRLDKAGSAIRAERGFHRALSLDLLQEPAPVYCHHFPYREEAATRRRFNRLFGLDGSAPARAVEELHMELRRRSIDAIYRQRWHEVSFFPPCARGYVPELRPFDEWVGPEEAAGLRALTPSAPP